MTTELLLAVNLVLLIILLTLRISEIIILRKRLKSIISVELERFIKEFERFDRVLREELSLTRSESSHLFKEGREESNTGFKNLSETLLSQISNLFSLQKNQLATFQSQLNDLTRTNEERFENLRQVVEGHLKEIQEKNSRELERIREVVDEKLQTTLEKRLGESFNLVSERLEMVQKGLGEMQTLASDVGDLKKVMTNVKTKGVLGEYQLSNILEQILSPGQYAKNVKTKQGSDDQVEFALKFPGPGGGSGPVWLPIDAKTPTEDYQSLMNAYESGDLPGIEKLKSNLNKTIKNFAKTIRDKYLDPPNTTEFAIMFLPFEGLYAEVLRDTALFEQVQREYKVVITGPTTLAAILTSLQMGFKTLALEKRSGEVWNILRGVKAEFDKFGDVLKKAQEKINQASENIDTLVGKRTRKIQLRLKNLEKLPGTPENTALPTESDDSDDEE
ncbi:MAG TPA: DNA recombination protein RmuC [Firmicutes bacterium]|nr:DNA recombination protein RmuC [Bacillota bacterium]